MKLALNVIAKDENLELKRIISVYSAFFDEICIAYDDDKAIDGIEQTEKVRLFKYDWRDDFSHKRNFLAERTNSPYYFRIDTDDEIQGFEKIREVFDRCVAENFDVVYFPYIYSRDEDGNCNAQHWRETIIKKRQDIYWKKEIHENIFVEDESRFRGIKCHDIKIIHNITPNHVVESSERNLRYLLAEFNRDKGNTDPRTISYIGRVLMGKGEYKKAIPFLELLIAKSGWDDDKYFAWVHLADCLHHLKDDKMALAACNEALEINTKYPDAYIKKGSIYLAREDYDKALDWIMPGIVRPMPDTTFVLDPTIYNVTSKIYACLAFMGKGDYEKAAGFFKEVERVAPSCEFVKNNKQGFLDVYEAQKYFDTFKSLYGMTKKKDCSKVKALIESIPSDFAKDERLIALKNLHRDPVVHSDKDIVIYCGPSWEDWADPSVIKGIGGSEEAVIYLSRELVKLGYEVTVYNQCGDFAGEYSGVKYINYLEFSKRDKYNILISWRNSIFTEGNRIARKQFVWMHDVPVNIKDLRNNDIDKIIVLSEFHKGLFDGIPEDKLLVSSNGINIKDFIPSGTRNPKRMIYTSSYDRGIEHLLFMWPEIKSAVPDAELHLFYGWNTYDKMLDAGVRSLAYREEMTRLMGQPGIFEHGRVGHRQLIKEFYKSGLYVYPCHFEEISCISAMKAQACGCVPVTTDYAALNETVRSGVKISGVAGYGKTNEDFKTALIYLLNDTDKQELLRQEVIKHKEEFGWDKVAKQWSEWF